MVYWPSPTVALWSRLQKPEPLATVSPRVVKVMLLLASTPLNETRTVAPALAKPCRLGVKLLVTAAAGRPVSLARPRIWGVCAAEPPTVATALKPLSLLMLP